MKRNFIIPSILCVLLLAACSNDSDPLAEGQGQVKTPLTISGISIAPGFSQGDRDAGTRATAAEDFFEDGDVIVLSALFLEPGVPDYDTDFAYNKSTNTWKPTEGAAPIYLEDVYSDGAATHGLRIFFGAPHFDQSTPEAFHQSDYIGGAATLVLDANGRPTPKVRAEKLERGGLLLQLTIAQGKYWEDDAEFFDFLHAHDARFVDKDGNTYTPYQPAGTRGVYHIIRSSVFLPKSGDPIFQLRKKDTETVVATCRWTPDDPNYQPTAGTILTIAATLDKENGEMGAPVIGIKPWGHNDDEDKDLPGEREP